MGGSTEILDPSKLTRSGIRCLEELAQIALLAHSTQVAPEWLIVTCTTCVEAHFDRVINLLIEISQVENNRFAKSLLVDGYDDIFRSWDSRLKWLDKGFGVAISGDRPMQDYRALVDLRNAVVHGQGNLTTLQQRNFGKLLTLKRRLTQLLAVQFSGPKVLLLTGIEPNIIEICRGVTVFLDSAVLALYAEINV